MPISATFIVPHPPLIVPAVGRGQESQIQKTIDSCQAIARQVGEIKPQTIILISPHATMYADYIHVSPGKKAQGSLKQFGAPETYHVEYDTQMVKEIDSLCNAADFPAGTLGGGESALDHGTLVPLYFVNQFWSGYQLVRCGISGLGRQDHYRFGMILSEAVHALDRNAVIIASGDLSHRLTADGPYGFAPEGPELDSLLVQIMEHGSFGDFFSIDSKLCQKGAECGLAAFITMAGAIDKKAVETRFLSYEGSLGVGYAVCAYRVIGDDPGRNFLAREITASKRKTQSQRDAEDDFVQLARKTLEQYAATKTMPPLPGNLPEELTNSRAGVFVSIKQNGQLRGCIGTTEPTQPNIAAEIMHNAISAGVGDPRFPPVRKDELPGLIYSVDVLTPAKPVSDRTMLDAKRFGVIVTCGRRRGLLLPDLDGVDTVEQQIEIARQKAGIGKHEDFSIEYFEVVRHT